MNGDIEDMVLFARICLRKCEYVNAFEVLGKVLERLEDEKHLTGTSKSKRLV